MTERDPSSGHPHDELAVYALGALPADEAAALEDHLLGCESCQERLRWLTPAVDEIPAGVPQQPAPPALRERLMAVVDAEAEVPRSTAEASADSASAPSKRRWLPHFDGLTLRPALAGLAVVLLLAAGVVGYQLHDTGGSSDSRTFSAQAASGDATGTLEVEGDQGSLRVTDMPPPPGDDVYQAWIRDEDGAVTPSVVFVTSDDGSGSVAIPHGLEDAAEVMVTREPRGGSDAPTEAPLMTARLD